MNYAGLYERLIARARGRVLSGYRERHHILPRCMGGSNDALNLVDLTAEEHYVAHQLLVKMHPNIRGLVGAAAIMARRSNGNKAYGWLRRKLADELKGNTRTLGMKLSPEARAKISAAQRGKARSRATIEKISAAHKGKRLSAEQVARLVAAHKGKRASLETREKMSAARRGRKVSPEIVAKVAAAQRGKFVSDETRAKLSLAHIGRRASPETRAKMSATHRANPPFLGRKHSADALMKIRAARARQIIGADTRAKLSKAAFADWARRKQVHQGEWSWPAA